MIEIDCVIDSRSLLGEATCWDDAEKVLWWVDIWAPAINRFDPATGVNRSWPAPEYLGTISVRAKGGLVVTMVSGFYFFDPETGRFEAIADPESEIADSRFNDGKTDRQGRFWSGSMFEAPDKPPARIGALWRLDQDLTLHKIIDGIGCANGLAWSPDSRTMYFTDSHENVVRAYDFDPVSGDVENRRVFIDLSDEGFIVDGATVDADGNYWMTIPFNSKLRAYDPAGRMITNIDMPADTPTCCEFGGPDLDTLFVTSATLRRGPEDLVDQPNAGGVFAIRGLGAKGIPATPFAG